LENIPDSILRLRHIIIDDFIRYYLGTLSDIVWGLYAMSLRALSGIILEPCQILFEDFVRYNLGTFPMFLWLLSNIICGSFPILFGDFVRYYLGTVRYCLETLPYSVANGLTRHMLYYVNNCQNCDIDCNTYLVSSCQLIITVIMYVSPYNDLFKFL